MQAHEVGDQPNESRSMSDDERLALAAGAAVLLVAAVVRRGWLGAGLAVAGGALAACAFDRRRISSGIGAADEWIRGKLQTAPQSVHVERAITIQKPRLEVYNFWRDLRNLPRFMDHIERITVIDGRRSHWVVKGPAGTSLEWDSEIVADEAPERIEWRAAANADIPNSGSVEFRDAPGRRGTEVRVVLDYAAPGGEAGRLFARLFGREPGQETDRALRRLKQLLEAGELATVHGQPSGRA